MVPCSMLGCISPHSVLVISWMDRMKRVTCEAGTWFLASTSLTCHFHHFPLKLHCKWNFAFLFSVLGNHACGVSYHVTDIWYLFAYCRCKLLGKKTSLLFEKKKKKGLHGQMWKPEKWCCLGSDIFCFSTVSSLNLVLCEQLSAVE